ncbi:MAG: hypothetical protein KF906_06765 [Actinobacteria bacterium]|nr:hypothetical protein [Actinomycetota bacterium]
MTELVVQPPQQRSERISALDGIELGGVGREAVARISELLDELVSRPVCVHRGER